MSVVSGFPSGLLSILDSKNFGENPRVLIESIQPVIPVIDLFLLTKQVVVPSVPANPVVLGNQANTLLVPDGEVWRVHAASAFMSCGVGVTCTFSLTIQAATFTSISQAVSCPASQERTNPMVSPAFYLGAGFSLGLRAHEVTGAPIGSITAMISRLKA